MGAIINFFKGIIELVTGLFTGRKKSEDGFFMEAPPVEGDPASQRATAVAATPKAEAAKKQGGGVPKQAKGKAGKVVAAAAVAAATTVTATPAEPVSAVTSDPNELIQGALAASTPKTSEAAAAADPKLNTGEPTFAEMNAVPYTTAGRRRPGPTMGGFLDLAKTMKK